MAVATYDSAKAAYRIGLDHANRSVPSEADKWDNPGLRVAYLQGYAAGIRSDAPPVSE
jgi:hypothetical protein